ncbi:MAG: hypothetical protein DRN15_09235 [Thermoprotei archaeon]|nr:MAG: hypothetical protein DRN15_09235 [Thermoprotei archaeon]RLF24492.1 MAG: hypothetical protein DRM97_03345 [Thermoprotei archaeon]
MEEGKMSNARITRLLAEIKRSLEVARSITDMVYDDFMRDIRNRYTLRLAIVEIVEASVSLGLYILREFLNIKVVEGYSQVFRRLVEHGVISARIGEEMERLVRLRNLIIHRYWEVDDSRIYKEARGSGLKIVEDFIKEVSDYVSRARDV